MADVEASGYMKVLRRTLSHLYSEYAGLHDAENLAARSERIALLSKPAPGDSVLGALPPETSEGQVQISVGAIASTNRMDAPAAPIRSWNQ